MKVAVIKIGSRISFGSIEKTKSASFSLFGDHNVVEDIKPCKDTSGGNGEAKAIIKMLYDGGADVTIYTKILNNDYLPTEYKFKNILDLYTNKILETDINSQDYDALIVVNGNYNCFGGAEDSILLDLANYNAITKFNKKVFYCLCDPALILTDIWKNVKSKPWASNHNESDLRIDRDDIIYICQAYDTEVIKNKLDKQKTDNKIIIKNFLHYPFEKFPALYDYNYIDMCISPKYDLLYGGTMRSGRRAKKMVKFYYGYSDDINVEMFGKLKEDELNLIRDKYFVGKRAPKFGDAVNYLEFCKKMNNSLAHVVIGDKLYEESNDVPQRTYESICSNVITFIDKDIDTKKRVFGSDEFLKSFMYVDDYKDVENKINMIKNDPDLRYRIINQQKNCIFPNSGPIEYCKNFVKLIENNI